MAMFDTMSGPLSTYKSFTLVFSESCICANEDSGEIGQKLIQSDAISPLRLFLSEILLSGEGRMQTCKTTIPS